MSNEKDLDWLARNVHEWPSSSPDRTFDNASLSGWEFSYGEFRNGKSVVTKDQWLARRAELQNKPSWADAPEWAQWLGQDEDGVWYWHGEEPNTKGEDVNGCRYWMSRGLSDIARRGELLGDWRDTLERRPTDLSEPAVTARLIEATKNVLMAAPALMDEKYSFEPEFMPVSVSNETVQLGRPIAVAGTGMSIGEWAAKYSGKTPSAQIREAVLNEALRILRDHPDHFSADELADLSELTGAELAKRDAAVCGGQKYIDAHWYERGELPPAVVECEIFGEDASPEKCKIIAYHKDQVAVQWESFGGGTLDVLYLRGDYWKFRPIRTERDVLMDIIRSSAHPLDDVDVRVAQATLADAILAAGFKRGGA